MFFTAHTSLAGRSATRLHIRIHHEIKENVDSTPVDSDIESLGDFLERRHEWISEQPDKWTRRPKDSEDELEKLIEEAPKPLKKPANLAYLEGGTAGVDGAQLYPATTDDIEKIVGNEPAQASSPGEVHAIPPKNWGLSSVCSNPFTFQAHRPFCLSLPLVGQVPPPHLR